MNIFTFIFDWIAEPFKRQRSISVHVSNSRLNKTSTFCPNRIFISFL